MTKSLGQSEASTAAAAAIDEGKTPPRGGNISDDPQLPKREIAFYLVALVSIITYAGYGFYLTYGQDPLQNLAPEQLQPGWMREFKDIGEDNLMGHAARNWMRMLVASIGYLAVSKVTLAWTPITCHHILCSAYTLMLTSLAVSPEAAVSFLALYTVALCLSYFSFVAVWLLVGALLYGHNCDAVIIYVSHRIKLEDDSSSCYAAIFGYLLCRLVSLSHSLQKQLQQQQSTSRPTFFQHCRDNLPLTLHYTFYMPYHWCGPILTYDTFRERLAARGRAIAVDRSTAALVAWRSCRMLFWFFVLQLLFHYIPVGSYLYSLRPGVPVVYKHLAFAMFLEGQNFMLVYVQFYGWPAAVAKLDGIQLPDWPSCISWVYSYSIMWRVFDRGLFSVMQAHIYAPLGGSRRGLFRQILAICANFGFICVFHGDTSHVRTWVALNAAQLMVEKLISFVYMKHLRSTVTRYLSPRNEKRLVGYVISWNMMVSCGIIFFFLAGRNGFIVMPEFLMLRRSSGRSPLWHMLTMQFAAYCAVQIGRFYEVKAFGVCKKGEKIQ